MHPSETIPSSSILLAEDEETEIMLFKLALKSAGLSNPLNVVRDGQQVIEYLSGRAPFEDRTVYGLPGLVILDLKMPRLTGFEVLAWLSSQSQLKHIPAVVLSSSSYPEDIQKAGRLGAREYYVKPHSTSELGKLMRTALERWLPGRARAE